jgi:AcrR family transcriptional regulator
LIKSKVAIVAAVKRQYHAPVRAAAAESTRRLVLQAAADLFLDQGYVATTIAQIAERANVSRPTVFALGSKPELFALVRDVTIAGDDDPVPITARPSWRRVVTSTTVPEAIRHFATHSGTINQRYAPLHEVLHRSAAAAPEMTALWNRSEHERWLGARGFVASLTGKGRLALTAAAAVDAVWALNAPDTYFRLVNASGWPHRRYVNWLHGALTAALVPV